MQTTTTSISQCLLFTCFLSKSVSKRQSVGEYHLEHETETFRGGVSKHRLGKEHPASYLLHCNLVYRMYERRYSRCISSWHLRHYVHLPDVDRESSNFHNTLPAVGSVWPWYIPMTVTSVCPPAREIRVDEKESGDAPVICMKLSRMW